MRNAADPVAWNGCRAQYWWYEGELDVVQHGEVTDWADGDLGGLFEQRLDALLAELSPKWELPPLPEAFNQNEKFRAYWRQTRKRSQVAHQLCEQPDKATAVARAVLDAIVCDEDVAANRQLIEPALAALGRRAVQEHLISTIKSGT